MNSTLGSVMPLAMFFTASLSLITFPSIYALVAFFKFSNAQITPFLRRYIYIYNIEFGKLRSYFLTNLMLVTKSLALPFHGRASPQRSHHQQYLALAPTKRCGRRRRATNLKETMKKIQSQKLSRYEDQAMSSKF